MTQEASGPVDRLRDWLEGHPYVLPIVLLILGGCFRFYNLNWDGGQQLHPDERWIYEVLSGANGNPPISWPGSMSQLFDVRTQGGSPLNPHFFAYGSLPFYLLALISGSIAFLAMHVPALSPWSGVNTYGGLPMLGRGVSATIDLFATLLVFVLARKVYGYWVGIVAMALAAFTVLDIQLSHFYTVDTLLTPLCLLALIGAVSIAQSNSRRAYIFAGLAFGAAMATKTTGLLLVIPLGVAAVLNAWQQSPWPSEGRLTDRLSERYRAIAPVLNSNLQWLLGTYLIGAAAFALLEPYGVLDRAQLVSDIAQQNVYLVTNSPPFEVPYTIQYAHTIPYVYQLANILFWDQGLPLALAAFGGVLFALARNLGGKIRADQAVLLLWVIPYFLFVGHFFAKFSRYMLPILPVITLFGAALLVWLVRRTGGRWRAIAWTALSAVVGLSFLYSLAYMNIYEHPNTRIAASQWIYAHIAPGSTIATEGAWDDPLPLGLDGHSGSVYHYAGADPNNPGLNLYNPDDQNKVANVASVLTHADYIVMSSERMIGSIPKLPARYPVTVRYYDLLFSNRLNFRLVKVFQEHPQLGPIVVHDYPADESFHVYDHPIVRIFKRVRPITTAQVTKLLTAGLAIDPRTASYVPVQLRPSSTPPADRRLMLSARQWQADQSSPTMDAMFPLGGFAMSHPILVWWLILELLGLIAFPLVFIVFGRLIDRGFVISKTVGLLLAGYLVWIGVSAGVGTFDRGIIYLALTVLAVVSAVVAYRVRSELGAFFRSQRRYLLTAEAVFLAGFVFFLLLRMWYPDLGHQFSPVAPANAGDGRMGEKQMELAYLNAIVRSRVFPPYDPFFSHGYINYYYYGFFLVGTLCKLTQIVPATGFNLAIATFFALLVSGACSVAMSLTRRLVPGVVAAVLVGAIGNLAGAWQAIGELFSVGPFHSGFPFFGGLLDALSGVYAALVLRTPLPSFDFWTPTRIVPPTGVISEFPYFTYLFADLHPHLMAFPMTVAALALAVNLLLGAYEWPGARLLTLLVGAVLLGAIAVTNPWDYPTYLVAIGIGAGVGAFVRRRRLSVRGLLRPAGWMVALAALSFLLYLPFTHTYQTVFVSGVGLVRDITPQVLQPGACPPGVTVCPADVRAALVTPLSIYLEHFGLFLFILLSYLTLLLLLHAGGWKRWTSFMLSLEFTHYHREKLFALRRAARVVRRMAAPADPVLDTSLLAGILILVIGLGVLQYMLLAFLVAVTGLVMLLVVRLARQLPAPQLFVLVLLFVPLGLSIGTQVFFVKDWLAGGTMYRMNTIFKFYNQAWVLYAIASAVALYYFVAEQESFQSMLAAIARRRGPTPARATAPPRLDLVSNVYDSRSTGPLLLADPMSVTAGVAEYETAQVAGGPLPEPVELATTVSTGARVSPAGAHGDRAGVSSGAGETPAANPLGGWEALQRIPLWTACLLLLLAGSLVYTYAGTVSRETYRTSWLPENSVPFTLDGMAFMKTAYPGDYAGIQWLNAHVAGAPVIAEANKTYYQWPSRVGMFTGLPEIYNGIHEPEQRYGDEIGTRPDDVTTLYNATAPADAWRIIHAYGVKFIYVGFSERQLYARAGLNKFDSMVGHGLTIAFRAPGVTIFRVTA